MGLRNLRHFRKAVGFTQLGLHRKARVSRTKISLAECGYVVLKPKEMKAIRRVLLREARRRTSVMLELLQSR
jgi:predicted transcriptional regulator